MGATRMADSKSDAETLEAIEAELLESNPAGAAEFAVRRDMLERVGEADGLTLGDLVSARMISAAEIIEDPATEPDHLRAVASDLMYWGSLAAKRLLLDYRRPSIVTASQVRTGGRLRRGNGRAH